jgi:OTU domain-containing protein 5
MSNLGFEIKQMNEDGACLFRSIADQVYGDQEFHYQVRQDCMNYIVSGLFKIKCFCDFFY